MSLTIETILGNPALYALLQTKVKLSLEQVKDDSSISPQLMSAVQAALDVL